jgi:hypothetical protein
MSGWNREDADTHKGTSRAEGRGGGSFEQVCSDEELEHGLRGELVAWGFDGDGSGDDLLSSIHVLSVGRSRRNRRHA